MSLTVIAEGVETVVQERFLVKKGCDMMQGYRYARPMPLADFMVYLDENSCVQSPLSKAGLYVIAQKKRMIRLSSLSQSHHGNFAETWHVDMACVICPFQTYKGKIRQAWQY